MKIKKKLLLGLCYLLLIAVAFVNAGQVLSSVVTNMSDGPVVASDIVADMVVDLVEIDEIEDTLSDITEVKLATTPSVIRGIELHPDLIFAECPSIVLGNIITFAERAVAMKVNTVFVHAFVGANADGAFGSAYFDNSVLPVRANLLSLLVRELSGRGIAVYAIMPLLSFAMTETDSNNAMMVMSKKMGEVRPSKSWCKRLSPFNTNSISLITQIYTDLSKNVPLNGIVFGDDAYLTDKEDLNPAALDVYSNKLGIIDFDLSDLDSAQGRAFVDLRKNQLDILCETIMVVVKKEQPQMQFVRTLYATAINYPPSEEWLSQNYKESLKMYDKVLVLADPELEDARSRGSWICELSKNVVSEPSGAERTIFGLPNYSNIQRGWISAHQQAKLLRMLSKAGINNFVLGPDNYIADRPRLKKIKKLF